MSAKKWAAPALLALAACTANGDQAASTTAQAATTLPAATPVAQYLAACEGRDGWSDAAPPVRLFGNVYQVGTCGITVLLIVSTDGNVLIDGAMDDAAPSIAANIEALGQPLDSVKWIVTSHEHLDHVGGVAELQRRTGAKVAALAAGQASLRSGKANPVDPQAFGLPDFPPIRIDRTLTDGEVLTIGSLAITAHATPAHTSGSTSWTWTSCEGAQCRKIAYADSATTPVSGEYSFADHPDYVAQVRRGLAAITALDCDLLITPHPSASGLYERLSANALAETGACRAYGARATQAFDARLAAEKEKTGQ
ncbi:subclass B3 metallo-beta-lactamase [Altererythrobacter xixiisoli]|uniref:Subclass B3 metallo-beta-lactamase n=1 Tax=Croceibacterium xixiisoli TaxID=1476466 RepID=A0A6I4TSZ5_9SPHN|nr:subclass B3 metallo-beta-lactamase [Croceibacterium xixiisoli]MXO99076.1 subclass B3 metallo-beta-lactamase [Croceibacterium xixiisoli]